MAAGSIELDFGAFPGSSEATVAVTGQAAIVAGSLIECWVMPKATADHSVGEHIVEKIRARHGEVVAGTGFTIHGTNESFEPGVPADPLDGHGVILTKAGNLRLYGLWTMGWAWS